MKGIYAVTLCARCPQTINHWYGRHAQTLCLDCRYVLNADELEVWAA